MNDRRGFTLIELMISIVIMLVAVAMAGALLMAGTNLSTTADQKIAEADDARIAVNEIVKNVLLAADGAPSGIYLNFPSGSPQLYSPIFGQDGTQNADGSPGVGDATGTWNTDDLWLVVPDKNAMREGCVAGSSTGDDGAATIVLAKGTGKVTVRCTDTFNTWDTLEATNMSTAALLSPPLTLTAAQAGPPYVPGLIDFAESAVPNYSDSPSKGGFQLGDEVFRVSVLHYYVRRDPKGIPGLYVAHGALGGSQPGGTYPDAPYPVIGRPFHDYDPAGNSGAGAADTGVLVQPYVEDLQIAYGLDNTVPVSGDPARFTWQNGFPAQLAANPVSPALRLRALRISVVVRTQNEIKNSHGDILLGAETQRPQVENHYLPPDPAAPAADGYRRIISSRTVVLPNIAAGSL